MEQRPLGRALPGGRHPLQDGGALSRAPLISIIIATRNAAGTLAHCLDSIRAQSFRDFELVVMDGASADGTLELLKTGSDVVTRWRSQPDRGIYHAWNKALSEARGEWICFLGADDRLSDPRALERLVAVLHADHGCRVVYSRVRFVDAAGAVIEEIGEPWPRAKQSLHRGFCLPQPGLMHHRSLFEEHGRFDESFRIAGDYEFLLRELKSRPAFYVPAVTVTMLFRGVSARPENLYEVLGETRRALALHGLEPPRLRWAYASACAWLYLRLRRLFGDRIARRAADLYRIARLRKPRYCTPEE